MLSPFDFVKLHQPNEVFSTELTINRLLNQQLIVDEIATVRNLYLMTENRAF